MDLTAELHVAAGLGALGLGGAALMREPIRSRNRLFALLCAALATWNLGVAAEALWASTPIPWYLVYLLGSCSAAGIALHFALNVVALARWPRGALLVAGYAASGALWASAWTHAYSVQPAWNTAALVVLGGILLVALVLLARHVRSLTKGREKSAYQLLLGSAVAAAAGGLSDFLPRDPSRAPKIGPVMLLILLLVLSGIVLRHRFLDVNRFLVRAVALLAFAAVASLVLFAAARITGDRFVPFFLITVAVVLAAAPMSRSLMTGAWTVLSPEDPVIRTLIDVSRRLPQATSAAEVWDVVDQGRRALSGDVRVAIYLREGAAGRFRAVFRGGMLDPTASVSEDWSSLVVQESTALPRLLMLERAPLTRVYLADEARRPNGGRAEQAREAGAQLDAAGAEMATPLLSRDRLTGWILVGGGHAERYLTADVAAAFLAVGQQAVASLERLEALEVARRREALAVAGEMAAGLAHEVRNPVAALRGAAQVLLGEADPERAREMLDVIQEETQRLGRVVGDFLDYARPASPRRQPVDLAEVARNVLRSAEVAGIETRAHLCSDERAPAALGDPDQIQRALLNLVRNAREAAGPGGSVRLDVAPAGAGRVAIRVEDNGPGIPEPELSRLFQPFTTTKPGGTGLGLALALRIVEDHGGEILVEGRPGEGAAFTMVLPSADVAA